MKRWGIGALSVALVLAAAASPVHAAPVLLVATLQVNDVTFNLDLSPDPSKSGRSFFDEVFSNDDFEIFARGTLDADPMAAFGLTVSNFAVAPLSVVLSIGVPFAPIAAPVVTSGITGTLTPGAVDPLGLDLTPTLLDTDGDGILELMSSGDGVVNFGIDVGPGASLPGALPAAYGPFLGGPILGPPGLAGLQLIVAFSVTGGGDTVDLTGSTIVAAVPEPASVVMFGLGALAAGARLRRRTSAGC